MANRPITKYALARQFAWLVCALTAIATVWQIGNNVLHDAGRISLLALLVGALYSLSQPTFPALGALVISRQPHHMIGWLMFAPVLDTFLTVFSGTLVSGIKLPPNEPSALFLVAVVANRVSWVLSVFPLLLILLLFPTGRPPSRRWNGLIFALVGLQILFVFVVSFGQNLLPFDETWSVANPIGFISDDWVRVLYSTLLQVVLAVLTLLCIASLWVRYKQGSFVERTQIKWIAYVGAIFGGLYSITILTVTSTGFGWGSDNPVALIAQLPTTLALLAIPVVIAIAILRYHLFDIDIIIRRTLVYSVLTLLLGAAYFAIVVLLQTVFVRLTGQESGLAVVASTLGIAALFGPLRRWVQAIIDRRFFRRKYDARRVLDQFAMRAQQQADIDALVFDIVGVVDETVQPEGVRLWLVPSKERR